MTDTLFEPMARYLNDTETKSNLHNLMSSDSFETGMSNIMQSHLSYNTVIKNFVTKIQDAENVMTIMFDSLLNVLIPLLTYKTARQLAIVEKTMTVYNYPHRKDSPMYPYLSSMGTDLHGFFAGLQQVLFTNFKLHLKTLNADHLRAFGELQSAVNNAKSRLKEFNSSSLITEKFFK